MRQKPGPTNSLGLVKLMFPNEYNVYLHSTPAPQLFSQTRRDFSHGCIRVEKPAELAAWVLRDKPAWSAGAGAGRHEQRPGQPAGEPYEAHPGADPIRHRRCRSGGQVQFFDDIYGYDDELRKVLAKGYPYPGLALPAPDAADVHMNEIGFRVISDTAAVECQSRISNMGSADAG